MSYFYPNNDNLWSRRKSPSPSPRRRKSRSPSPIRRRKSRSPSQKRYRRKRSRSVTSSPITKSQSPRLGPAENKNAIDKQRLEEEKKRWEVSALLYSVIMASYDHTSYMISLMKLY
uniref:Uncharacterized protein n=1 Tax=Arundo donax TaxID=35708 RepID=A0A0A8XNJ8_ARUDO